MTAIAKLLAELREIHEKTTSGFWTHHDDGRDAISVSGVSYVCPPDQLYDADARAIAISHNAFPALLRIAKAARDDHARRNWCVLSGGKSCPLCDAFESLSKVDVGGEK